MESLQKLIKMPITVIQKCPNLIEIKNAYVFQKSIGLFFVAVPIIIFISFMIMQPERMGKSITVKAFSMTLIIILIFFLVREVYFFYIDRSNILSKNGLTFEINGKFFLIKDIDSILIIEYNGIGIMANGYNVFMRLKGGKNIPISIRISKDDSEKVKNILCQFFNIEKIDRKKWWIH